MLSNARDCSTVCFTIRVREAPSSICTATSIFCELERAINILAAFAQAMTSNSAERAISS